MSSSPARPPSSSTTTSMHKHTSIRSNRPVPTISTVVTVPPWAKDEPPSPKEQPSISDFHYVSESRPSDIGSFQSVASPSRWWTFTHPWPTHSGPTSYPDDPSKSEKKPQNSFKDRSMAWLPSSATAFREGSSFVRRGEKGPDSPEHAQRHRRDWNLSISLPTPVANPFTLTHNATPGWETPWTARPTAQGPSRSEERDDGYGFGDVEHASSSTSSRDITVWQRRKKRLRAFILTNTYVPLLFRFINLTFTTIALGVAIRVRQREREHGVMGALGSSPTLVIIFAPLTLVHVLTAVYLEYFGRPLGLWRTSGKLAHTLLEVLFICAWSAALSLCFDNFFTSLVPCASPSATSWYNELPRPASNLPTFEGSVGDTLCDSQLALICLVGVGLLMYCSNLVISLFRIFEKVKYHSTATGFS
ncbi:hypothetical protein ARMSODRAFT_949092 [Armillaria solidipes]|uniref:Uncharacterized protein n=2 Tax=Armillaria TaxID=47424 RepID=A0A2H3CD85_9AGAR|nr:hypothetical protein EV421DRAFT_1752440 [Armillaria borealis]PBK77192.1 hypothetical protein ARMSODRAFT_949092 [Armillaria solidipes]